MCAAKARITLRDIAARAGLSPMAVSLALRDHPRVSAATRERVKALASEMGYLRDPALSALASYRRGGRKQTSAVSLLLAGPPADRILAQGFLARIVEGAARQAREIGYELSPYWLDPALSPQRHGRILATRGVRGILVGPFFPAGAGKGFEFHRFPGAVVGVAEGAPAYHAASSNHFEGLFRACAALESAGYTRIGLYLPQTTHLRLRGRWRAAMLERNASLPRSLRVEPKIVAEDRPETFLRWFKNVRPEVVLTVGERASRYLAEGGFSIPDDVGYAVLEAYEASPGMPRLSGIEQHFDEIGAAAMSLLHAEISAGRRGPPPIRHHALIAGTWTQGESTRSQPPQREAPSALK